MANFVVLGGGIAGIRAALRLADAGHKITIVERLPNLAGGTSRAPAGRLDTGLHKSPISAKSEEENEPTDLDCVISFLRNADNAHFVIGQGITKCLYVVVKDSLFTPLEIGSRHAQIQKQYRDRVKDDIDNKVLGEVDDFTKSSPFSDVMSYVTQGYVNPDVISTNIFEAVTLNLDIPSYLAHQIDKVKKHRNITVRTNNEIIGFERCEIGAENRFKIKVKPFQPTGTDYDAKPFYEELLTDNIVNCTGENIEFLDNTAGIQMTHPRVNRTKAAAIINLPPKWRDVPNLMFIHGAFASLTNYGDGTAYLTYEDETNIKNDEGIREQTTQLEVSEYSKQLLTGTISAEKKQEIGKRILLGAQKFMTFLKDPEITLSNVLFGNVRTEGDTVDINSRCSPHHVRPNHDVTTKGLGHIDFALSKFVRHETGADKVLEEAKKHLTATSMILRLIDHDLIKTKPPGVRHAFQSKMDDLVKEKDFSIETGGKVSKTLRDRTALMAQIDAGVPNFNSKEEISEFMANLKEVKKNRGECTYASNSFISFPMRTIPRSLSAPSTLTTCREEARKENNRPNTPPLLGIKNPY